MSSLDFKRNPCNFLFIEINFIDNKITQSGYLQRICNEKGIIFIDYILQVTSQ